MHYFVTGASGSIGRYLTSLLLAEGHAVTTLVRSRGHARAMADFGVRPHVGDVRDKESMRRGMRGADGVFHTAAWRTTRSRDRRTARAVNVRGTRNVLDLVAELHISKAVITSSVSVFGDTRGARPVEGHRFDGKHTTVSDRTRWEAHHLVVAPAVRNGLPLVVVQPGAAYGPGDDSDLSRMLRRYVQGRLPVAPTRTAYSWTHLEDIAAGHLLAMERGRIGGTYVICGEPETLLAVLRMAGRLIGRRRGPFPIPGRALRPAAAVLGALGFVIRPLSGWSERLRHLAGATYLGDASRARRELGFSPRTLAEGMPDTVRSLLEDLFESG